MLQRIRDGLQGQKWLAWTILGAIAATFVFWGGSNSLDFSGVGANTAAEVDGAEIPAEEATNQWGELQAQWASANQEIPAELQKSFQAQIIEDLVFRKLISERIREQNFRISDDAVMAFWMDLPEFQTNNAFDRSKAAGILAQQRKSERQFLEELRQRMLETQLNQGLAGSGFLTPAERQRFAALENEEREVQYLQLTTDRYASSEAIDDPAIEAYHAANGDRFKTAEYVALEFAELRLEELAAQVAPTEADLRKLYDENSAAYVREEGRRARSIIIAPGEGEDDAAAQKKAEAVAVEARSGKDFAELARTNSTDPITAAQGGDLGFVTRDQFQDPTIGDTLFAMKIGDISGPVKTQFGFQIFKLEEIQAREVQPFEDVRAELDSQYRTGHSAELFGERQEQITTAIEKGENDLDKLAGELGLTRGSVPQFLRGGGAEPLGSSPELQQRVFSDATLNQGRIGGPVYLGEDRMVVFKVREHHESKVKPVAEVREEIIALIRQDRAKAAAKAAAEGALKRLEGGESMDVVAKSLGLTVEAPRFVSRGDPSLKADLRTAVFEAPRPAGAPVVRLASLDDGSSALFVVSRSQVADSSTNPMLAEQQAQQLRGRLTRADVNAYINEARRKAKVVVNPKVFGEE